MSLLVLAFAEFELPDPWQIKTTDSSLIYKKPKSGKSKIRKLVQVSRKNGIHWRSQLVDAIESREKKLGTAASKLSADLQAIARNSMTSRRDGAPRKVLQLAGSTRSNNNRLAIGVAGLGAIGTAGLYLSNRSNRK